MKKRLFLLVFVVLMGSSSAWALSFADVGGLDSLLLAANVASDEKIEKAWVAANFGISTEDVSISSGSTGWVATDDDASKIYLDFGGGSNILGFFIKAAGPSSLSYAQSAWADHLLFTNLANLQYGVIDLGLLDKSSGKFEIGTISHYGVAGSIAPVPEPGTLVLLATGLAGLAWLGRKRNRA